MLAQRLARSVRGVAGGALAAMLSRYEASAAVPPAVASSTIQAAGLYAAGQAAAGGVSVKAVALAEGVLKAMLLAKLKTAAAVLVLVAVLGAAATALTQRVLAERPADPPRAEKTAPAGRPAAETGEVKGGDWPQWRGPNRDGVVRG